MRKRPGSATADVAVVLGANLALGMVCAVAWWLLTDLPEFTKAAGGGGSMGELQLAERFNADGWFAVIGALAGFLAGVGLSWWRSRDPLLTTLLVVAGSGLAAWVTATLGGLLGPGDPDAALAAAPPGQTVPAELAVHASAAYLVWPIAALLGTLMVLWSPPAAGGGRTPDRPEPAESAESAESAEGRPTGTAQPRRPGEDPASSRAPG